MNKDLMKHFEDQLMNLEDRCIHKVEDYYNDYLVEFLCDFKEVTGPFDDNDLFYFWLENASLANSLINSILQFQPVNNDYLLKAVKLKRIVDNELIKLKKEVNIDEYLNNDTESNDGITIIPLIPTLADKEQFVSKLYSGLYDKQWIECSSAEFKRHFIKSDIIADKINWLGKINVLAALGKFMAGKFISNTSNVANILVDHFCVNQKPLKRHSIEVMSSYIDDSDGKFEEVHKLVNSLKN